jgi:putative Mn2+ efflux pump MntP
MRLNSLTIPEIGFIAITRVALGVGIGLLLGGWLNREQRKGAGLALVAVGAVTTIPIAMEIRAKERAEAPLALVS